MWYHTSAIYIIHKSLHAGGIYVLVVHAVIIKQFKKTLLTVYTNRTAPSEYLS